MAARYYREFETAKDLLDAYDVEGSVPDFGVYARQFVAASADARRRLDCQLGAAYGPTRDEYADLFPAPGPGAPIVIFIHGGYWRSLSAREFSFCAAGPVAAGCAAVVANYSLSPIVTIGEIVRQMRSLVAWTRANASRLNGDPESIWVVGHSAGGHLSAMCALTDWPAEYGLPERTVRGVMPISGLFDLEPLRLTLQPELPFTPQDVERYSPLRLVRRVPTPMVITYGSEEPSEFHRHSEEFLSAWLRAGNQAEFFPQLGRNHFTAISDLAEADTPLTSALLKMIGHRRREAGTRRGAIDPRLFPRSART